MPVSNTLPTGPSQVTGISMEELTKFSVRYDWLLSGGSRVKGLEQRDLGEDPDKLTCLENKYVRCIAISSDCCRAAARSRMCLSRNMKCTRTTCNEIWMRTHTGRDHFLAIRSSELLSVRTSPKKRSPFCHMLCKHIPHPEEEPLQE